MTPEQNALKVFEEELVEVATELLALAKQVSKAIRFGIDEQRDLPTSNRQRIEAEWQDLLGSMIHLKRHGINLLPDINAISDKVKKIDTYTGYSMTLGTVVAPSPATEESAMSDKQNAETELQRVGLFAGIDGLRRFAECNEFWENQMYGTRLYFEDSACYLHRSAVQAAIEALDTSAARIEALGAQLAACEPFLKERETPAECIERNRRDVFLSMGQHAEALKRAEEAEAQLAEYREDAERYRTFSEDGLPICFRGQEYQNKEELDEAIDTARSESDTCEHGKGLTDYCCRVGALAEGHSGG